MAPPKTFPGDLAQPRASAPAATYLALLLMLLGTSCSRSWRAFRGLSETRDPGVPPTCTNFAPLKEVPRSSAAKVTVGPRPPPSRSRSTLVCVMSSGLRREDGLQWHHSCGA